jgi:hypothetical protein
MVANARATACRDVDPAAIVEEIKAGKWAKEVAAVRQTLATKGKEAADELKKRLPGILWTGTFSRRANDGLKAHAGFLCADLDAIPDRAAELHDALRADPHAAAAFVSPSGNGLKVVFRVAADADRHARSYAAVREHLRTCYKASPDEKAKDLARLCFVSHDPAAWWNPDATPLELLPEMPKAPFARHAPPPDANTLPPSALRLLVNGASQGERNASAFDLACQCRDAGKSQAEAEAVVAAFAGQCSPPLPEAEARAAVRSAYGKAPRAPARASAAPLPRIQRGNTAPDFDRITAGVRGAILGILTDANCKGSARNRAVARLVVGALTTVGKLYFHAERQDFDSAMFFDATAKRLLRIRADAFAAWFSEWLGINRADPLFKYAFAEVETAALSGAQTTGILPEAFWASRPGAIYLSNGDGSAAKITAEGVSTVDNGADGVLFAAGRTLAPWKLTEPRDPFETCRLFRDAHCIAAHGKDLLRLWLYSLPSNPPSKPPLCLPGAIGSGKTRTAKGFAELFGIPFVAHKVEEAAEDDFWPCCDAGGLFTLDNADTKCRWLADALANAATDGCSQRRKLYTNSETVILRARAWLCVTTANPTFAADSGLADRLLVDRFDRRDGEVTDDAELGAEILAARDAGLSHVAQTLAAALADKAPVPSGLNKRHPDFAAFAVHIGRALGREAEAIAALRTAEADKSAFCLENDTIGTALLGYLREARTFTGTAAELVPKLCAVDGELTDRLSAKRLAKRLGALWPHLQSTLATARKEPDRRDVQVFTFKAKLPALPALEG